MGTRAAPGWVLLLASLLAALLLGAGGVGGAWAQDLQPVPALKARVTDTSGTLTEPQRAQLEAQLAAFEREAGSQMVVLIVPTTQPEDIAAYAFRVADTWKVGRRGVGDGLLILVAMQDKRFRIEVARDLEGAIPDLAASRVLDNALRPAFRRGDYAGGLAATIDQLAALIRGEQLPAPEPQRDKRNKRGGIGWEELAMFFFVGVPIVGAVFTGVLGRKLGSVATGGAVGAIAWFVSTSLLLAGVAGVVALVLVGVMGVGAAGRRGGGMPVIWGGGGGGGWRGGGGGGGGFSSGGGGSFGGGGASGGW